MNAVERSGETTNVPPPPLPDLGAPWSVRVPRDERDLELIHHWMGTAHVAEFWCQDWPLDRWRRELATQLAGEHSLPCLIAKDSEDLAYIEVYRVVRDRLAGYYPHQIRDIGVHIAIGERERTGYGLGRKLLAWIAAGLLEADPHCDRIVAEPDARNLPSITAFRAAGFDPSGEIVLPDKTATLMVCGRNAMAALAPK